MELVIKSIDILVNLVRNSILLIVNQELAQARKT